MRDKEVASSKRKTKLKTKSAKIDTLFMTKMAAKWLKSIPIDTWYEARVWKMIVQNIICWPHFIEEQLVHTLF